MKAEQPEYIDRGKPLEYSTECIAGPTMPRVDVPTLPHRGNVAYPLPKRIDNAERSSSGSRPLLLCPSVA